MYPVTELTEERLEIQRVVCSAVRHKETGQMWCGPRHHNCLWQVPKDISRDKLQQGFVDQFFNFLTREEAWVIAERKGQIVRRCGGDGEKLYSENLY